MAKSKDNQEPTYKEAAQEVETILAAIEREDGIDIDELAGKVERAAQLLRMCSDRLKKAEARVRKVTEELAAERGDGAQADAGDEAPTRGPGDEVPF